MVELDRLKPPAGSGYRSTRPTHLKLANSKLAEPDSLSHKRKRRRRRSSLNYRLTVTIEAEAEAGAEVKDHHHGGPHLTGAATGSPAPSRLPLIILLLLKLSLLFLLVSDLPPSGLCLSRAELRESAVAGVTGFRNGHDNELGQVRGQVRGRKSLGLLAMEPAGSIFGSFLSANNNNGNSAAQQQQLLIQQQQQQAADLHQSYKNGQTSDKVTLPGDILLGGLFPIHMKGTKVECGEINRDRGIQRLEAMLYALDRINEDSNLLPGIKLGAILLDSCSSSTYALNQSLEFIRASINTVESSAFECKDKSSPRPKYGSKMIAGVIGGSYSEVSLQVANLLRLFRIPQVSYASTGTALSDKTLYDLFARTVPSDMFQARAIADIVLKLKWSYVSLVSSEGLYGDSGSREFMKQASVRQICIATHEKISPTTDNNAYDLIVANLLKRNATGVVLFTRAEDTRELLLAVKRANLEKGEAHNFAWVAADGWGTHQKLIEGVEEVAWGAITVELSAKAIPGFDTYMKALTPARNSRNPWFSEYWQEWFNCQLDPNLVQQQQVASGAAAASYRWPQVELAAGLEGSDAGHASASAAASSSAGDYEPGEARKRRRSLETQCEPRTGSGGGRPSNGSRPIAAECKSAPVSNGSAQLEQPAAVERPARQRRHLAEEPNGWQKANNVKQRCSPNLQISESNGYRQEQKVQFVVDAVYAMAHALHRAWFNLCDAQTAVVCEALKELNGGDFYSKYLLNVSFEDLAGSEVKFDERGDGLGRYNIYNFRQLRNSQVAPPSPPVGEEPRQPAEGSMDPALVGYLDQVTGQDSLYGATRRRSSGAINASAAGGDHLAAIDEFGGTDSLSSLGIPALPATAGTNSQPSNNARRPTESMEPVVFEYSAVGRWTESDYNLQLEDIEFIQGDRSVPESFCSRPCELGQAKIMRAGDHCCWICKVCAPYEYLPDEYSCMDCGIGRWPIQNKTSCYDLPLKYLRLDSPYSLATLAFACLGIACTLFVIFIFIRYLDTPVVKASGRELSFILLAGTAFCHLSTFILLAKPTDFICGSQRFLVNFGFALMYASLLVKTNRISRIFNCARKSAKRPSFISPKSQMLITGVLVAIQIFLTIVWFVFEPPGTRAEPPEGKRDQLILKCRAKGKSFIISLVYNMILITTCTVYAIKTRKIPENFNESKFIGFTMYTTIVIWMAFVTMFFGTHNSFETQILTMCICISLSAYSTLFCLFGPKISIILFHPDKNVRKLTMNSAQYKRPFKPVSSMASVDGRYNTTGGTYNGQQTDGGSGGPMSTTSNVLNPAESQAGRQHESSVASNVVNSNSAGSNCSNSQKTPTTLSQQLTLVGSCANCGAHQLAQVPMNAHSHNQAQQHHTSIGVFSSQSKSGNLQSGTSGRQVASACGGGGGSHATILKSSLGLSGAGQSASQCRLAGLNELGAKSVLLNSSTSGAGGGGRSSSILVASTSMTESPSLSQKQSVAGAKVMHSRIFSSATSSVQQASVSTTGISDNQRLGLVKRMSSDDHLLIDRARCGHQSDLAGKKLALASNQSSLLNQGGAQRRAQMASLSRLNELNSTTSSHCGHDESISSLVNESFVNTSQENTPCTGGAQGGHSRLTGAQQYLSGKGSDSMLWNQSVYSIDYCSDCCPSYCHCSCPACSSNGCDLATDGEPVSAAEQQAACTHARAISGTALDSIQQQQVTAATAADTEPDEPDSALCDQSISNAGESAKTTVLKRRRKSAEPSRSRLATRAAENLVEPATELASYYYDYEDAHQRRHTQVAGGGSGGSSARPKTGQLKQTRRSQTMEMRTIVVEKSNSGELKSGQSVDEETQAQQANQVRQLSKQHKQVGAAGPLVYALQAAASSAYSVAQMAATAGVQPSVGESQLGRDTSSVNQFTSTKDTNSEKLAGPARQPASGDNSSRQPTSGSASRQQLIAAELPKQHGQTGGAIQAGLEMVKSMDSSRRKSSDNRRHHHHHRDGSCLSYHDDYEYSYGLVQSNSDSENYYPDELSGDCDTSAGSFARDEASDDGLTSGRGALYEDYYDDTVDNEEEDDFEHDGRLTLGKSPLIGADGKSNQRRAPEQVVGGRHRLAKGDTATVKYRGSPAGGGSTSAAASQARQRPGRELQIDEHRINSVALITATLSAGGAIVESSGGGAASSSSQQQQQQPLVGGDKSISNLSGMSNQQQQEQKDNSNQPARSVGDDKQTKQMGCLTTL